LAGRKRGLRWHLRRDEQGDQSDHHPRLGGKMNIEERKETRKLELK